MEASDIIIGGLYSSYYSLDMWSKDNEKYYYLIDEMAPNKPFVVLEVILEVDTSLHKLYNRYKLKVLTCDGIVCWLWIDVGKMSDSIQSLTD